MKPDFNEIGRIVKQVKAGDGAAFAKLYELTYQRLFYLAFSILDNEEDAKDAVQESYIKIFDSIHSLHDDGLFLAWANKIVYSICIRMHARDKAGAMDAGDLYNMADGRDESNPVKAVLKSEKQKVLAEMINKLPPDLRATLLFKYYENMKIQQIASIMDCPCGTVKSRLSTAKKQLKMAINKGYHGNILYGIFPYFAFRQSLAYCALQSGMAPSAAYTTLIHSLGKSNISTAVRFQPQAPPSSMGVNLAIPIGGGAVGGTALAAIGTVLLTAPAVNSIFIVNPPEHFTNQEVQVSASIVPSANMLSRVYAADASGRQIPVTLLGNGTADFTVDRNGNYTVYVVAKNEKEAEAQIAVECIDKTGPVLTGYDYTDTDVVLKVQDDLSGIDYNKVYGETEDAGRIEPLSVDPSKGTVVFAFPKQPFRLFLSDQVGNLSTFRVRLVKK